MKKTKIETAIVSLLGDKKSLESPAAKHIHIKTPNIPVCSSHNFEEEEENHIQELLNSLLLTNDTCLMDVEIPVSYKVHNKLFEEVIIIGQQQVYIYNTHFINLKLHDVLRRMSVTLIQLEMSQCNVDNMSELICSQGNYLKMCKSLRYLNLSRNNLTDIPSCIIELNKSLQFLNLSGNKIGQFNSDNLLRKLNELIPTSVLVLHLTGNPVHTSTSSVSYRSSMINAFPSLYILDGYILLYREKYQHLNNIFSNLSFNYFISDIKLPMHVYHIAYSSSDNNNNNRIDGVIKLCQNLSNRINPIFVIQKACKHYLAIKRYHIFTSNGVINRFQSYCRSFILKNRLRNEMKSILQEQQQEYLLGYANGSLSMGILLKILHKFVTGGITRWRRRKSAIKIQLWYKRMYYQRYYERQHYKKNHYHGLCVPIFYYDEALEILHNIVQKYNKKHGINIAINTDNRTICGSEDVTIRKLDRIGLCKVMIRCKSKLARNYRYILHHLSDKSAESATISMDQMVQYASLKQWKQFVTIKRRPNRIKYEYNRFVTNESLMRSVDKFQDAAIPLYLIKIPDQDLLQDYFRSLTKKQMVYVYHDQYVFNHIAATMIQKRFRNNVLRKNMSSALIPKLLQQRAAIAIQRIWRFYRTVIRRLHFLRSVHSQVNGIGNTTLFMDSWLYYIAIRSQYLLPMTTNCYPEFAGVPIISGEGKVSFYSFYSNHDDTSSITVPTTQEVGNPDYINSFSDEIDIMKLQEQYDNISIGGYMSKQVNTNRIGFPSWLCFSLPLAKNCATIANRSAYAYGIYDILTTDVDVKLTPLQLDDQGTIYNVIKLQFSSIAEAKARCASLMLLTYSFYNHTSLKLLTERQMESYLFEKKGDILSKMHTANPIHCIESCVHLEDSIPHLVQSYETSMQDYIRFRYMIESMKAEQFNQNIADEDVKREFLLSKQIELYTKKLPIVHTINKHSIYNDTTSADITQVGHYPVFDDLTRESTKQYEQSQYSMIENEVVGNDVDGDDEDEDRIEVKELLLEILQRIENNFVNSNQIDNGSISIVSMHKSQLNSLEDSQVVSVNHLPGDTITESLVLSLGSSPVLRGNIKKRPVTAPNDRRPITPLNNDNIIKMNQVRTRVSTPINLRSIRTSSLWSTERLLYWCSRNQMNDQGTASRLELLQYNMHRAVSPMRSITPSMKDNRTAVKHDVLDVDISYNSTHSPDTYRPSKSHLHVYLDNTKSTEIICDDMNSPSVPVTPNPFIDTHKQQSWKEKLYDEKRKSVENYIEIESNLMKEYHLKKELELIMKQKNIKNSKNIKSTIPITTPITAPITLPFAIPLYVPKTPKINEIKSEILVNPNELLKRESIIELKNKKKIEKEAADLVAAFMKHSNKTNILLAKKYYNKKVKHLASKNKIKNSRQIIDLPNPSVPTVTIQTVTDTYLPEQSSELAKLQNVTLSNYGMITLDSIMDDSIISDEPFIKVTENQVNIEKKILFKPVNMNEEVSFTRGSNTAPSPPSKSIPTRQKIRSSYGKRPNTSHMTPPTLMQRQYNPLPVDNNLNTHSIISEPTESMWKEVTKEDRDHYRKIANDFNVAANKKYNEKIIQIPRISYKFDTSF